ncbi:MAG: aspartate 1-decarboxylase [Candidatus Omnitrophica bacterium]|nr:aspartate 1-decarboxylase [Candidatus Omnitrophota bacterium]
MWITFCKAKIAHATVTEAELYYEGSITIDEDLLKSVDILPGEKVEVLNLNNGARLETYTIAGKAGSGQICLNGPAARSGVVGDKVIVLSYALMDQNDAKNYKIKVIYLDENNHVRN